MAITQVRSPQIGAGEVKRSDLDVTTSGSAVLAKVIQGTGITISATGADAGTGDATINAAASAILDTLSATQGSILYRSASAWVPLGPGSAGQVLSTNGSSQNPSWIDIVAPAVISTANSSTTNLAGGATFTGTGESTLSYASVTVMVLSSHASAADGLAVEQSVDGTNWDIADYRNVAAGQAASFSVNLFGEFFRVLYVNGGTLTTTLRIECKKNPWPLPVLDGSRSNAPSLPAVATLTGTGDVAIVAAPGANKSIMLRTVKSYNTSATLTRVDLKDGATTFAYLAAAANGGGENYSPSRRIISENTAFNGALSVGVSSVFMSAEYVVVKS